jgi:hypothetical protein
MTSSPAHTLKTDHCDQFEILKNLVNSISSDIGRLSAQERISQLEAIRRAATRAYKNASPSLEDAISALVLRACNAFIDADATYAEDVATPASCSA